MGGREGDRKVANEGRREEGREGRRKEDHMNLVRIDMFALMCYH